MNITKIVLNFIAVLLLIGLIATPIYFAQKFAKVAGVESQSRYLVVSQIEKFPNLTLSQNGGRYTVTYTKFGPSQAFLAILIINNPTPDTQSLKLEKISGEGSVFFGEDLDDPKTNLNVPSQASVPVSLVSEETTSETGSIEFIITVNTE